MTTFSTLRGCLASAVCLAGAAFPGTAGAQAWDYTLSVYAWMSGIESSVGTPFGTLETELSFGDVLENLDFAFFATLEAQNGPWVVLGDLNYSALGTSRDTPFGGIFSGAEVDTTLTIASAFGGYAVVDRPDLRIEAGGGLRFYDMSLETRLIGNGPVQDRSTSSSDSWVDAILGVQLRAPISERWFARGYADVGGFGLGDSSELTWQVYAGGGYAFNETWAVEFGYRHLSFEKDFDSTTIEFDQSGPVIGVSARF